jgi:hypothetical protein
VARTSADPSLSFPTMSCRRSRAGGYGRAGGVVQGTSLHSALGYEEVKQPLLGRGTRDIPLRQSCRFLADGCGVVTGGVGSGVCARTSGAANRANDAQGHRCLSSPKRTSYARRTGAHEGREACERALNFRQLSAEISGIGLSCCRPAAVEQPPSNRISTDCVEPG